MTGEYPAGGPILRGIREKLLLSVSILVAAIAIFVYAFFPARLERQAMSGIAAKAATIRDMTAYALGAGLYFGDTTAVGEVVRGLALGREVSAVTVRNAAGQVVAAQGGQGIAPAGRPDSAGGAVNAAGDTYVTWAPVRHDGRPIGDLTIGLSLAAVTRDVADARRFGLAFGLVIFAVGFVAVLGISAIVTRPLTAVLETVEQISAGDLSRRAVEPQDAEVAPLVRGFNRMVDGLVGAQAELARSNELLETRVDERTREVRSAIDMLQSLIDLAPQAIVTTDLDWRVTRWNAAAAQLYGWPAADIVGAVVPFEPPERAAEFAAVRTQLAAGDVIGPLEVEHVRRDGRHVSVLLAANPLRDSDDRIVGYVSVVTDLTERKSLELQLRHAQKMEAVGRLAGGVAHDFNNVLTVISTSTTLIKDGPLTPDQLNEVEQISAAALRASAFTRQLLTFSRRQIVKLEPVKLNDVIGDIEKMLRRLLRANISCAFELGPDVGLVVADVTQLQQVILNLVVNASDAMPNGGDLTVRTAGVVLDDRYAQTHAGVRLGAYVLLTVTDTGIGMDSATANRIFEPFFTTKESGQGTGLGLATTYAVVSNLGGHIDLVTSPGVGTTFKVYIPALPADAATASMTQPIAREATVAAQGSETILLVEDEAAVRLMVRRTLLRLGYNVMDAPDGNAALTLAEAYDGPIDVLVTDIMMPRMDGRALADKLARVRRDIRVVFISGYTDETVNRIGLVRSGRTFVQKPFGADRIGRAIREMLAEPVTPSAEPP
ncbi:MAG: ATP-binding protein [Gemmatimonadota bacterium]|nr:ATP-binding protein [Gemmatimonadota bacterium]